MRKEVLEVTEQLLEIRENLRFHAERMSQEADLRKELERRIDAFSAYFDARIEEQSVLIAQKQSELDALYKERLADEPVKLVKKSLEKKDMCYPAPGKYTLPPEAMEVEPEEEPEAVPEPYEGAGADIVALAGDKLEKFGLSMSLFFHNKDLFKGKGFPKFMWGIAYDLTVKSNKPTEKQRQAVRSWLKSNPKKADYFTKTLKGVAV